MFACRPLTVTFSYDASDPLKVTMTGQAPNQTYSLPATGTLRLWRKNGYQPRNGKTVANGGDYIESGTAYRPSQLGFGSDNGGKVVLYVEPVGSATLTGSPRNETIYVQTAIGTTGVQDLVSNNKVVIAAPGSAVLTLCPCAVVSDPSNTYLANENSPVLSYVRFGLWDHAFDSSGNVLNGNSESGNFVGSDTRRFYIRVYDPSATTTTVTAYWYTKKADGTDDDHPSTDTITLTRSSTNPAVYVSKALMLVADEVDNAQVTNTGLSGGGNAAEGAADHRLRRAALGDTMCYAYTPAAANQTKSTFTVPLFGPSGSPDAVKTMTVQVANLYQGKSFTQAESDSYVQAIQASVAARWAVAGVKVNFQYAYGTQNDWVSVPSSTGVDLNAVEPTDCSSSGDEGKLAAIVKAKYSGADSHTIFLILFQQFAWDAGGTPGNYTQNGGEAFPDGLIAEYPAYAPSLHCSFVASQGLFSTSSTTSVPPHELGHQLGCQTADDTGNDNHYAGAQVNENLMKASAGDPVPGADNASIRLWDDASHQYLTHPLQIDYMRQSELLQ